MSSFCRPYRYLATSSRTRLLKTALERFIKSVGVDALYDLLQLLLLLATFTLAFVVALLHNFDIEALREIDRDGFRMGLVEPYSLEFNTLGQWSTNCLTVSMFLGATLIILLKLFATANDHLLFVWKCCLIPLVITGYVFYLVAAFYFFQLNRVALSMSWPRYCVVAHEVTVDRSSRSSMTPAQLNYTRQMFFDAGSSSLIELGADADYLSNGLRNREDSESSYTLNGQLCTPLYEELSIHYKIYGHVGMICAITVPVVLFVLSVLATLPYDMLSRCCDDKVAETDAQTDGKVAKLDVTLDPGELHNLCKLIQDMQEHSAAQTKLFESLSKQLEKVLSPGTQQAASTFLAGSSKVFPSE